MDCKKTDYSFFSVKLSNYLCSSYGLWTADNILNTVTIPTMPFVCFWFKMPVVIVHSKTLSFFLERPQGMIVKTAGGQDH